MGLGLVSQCDSGAQISFFVVRLGGSSPSSGPLGTDGPQRPLEPVQSLRGYWSSGPALPGRYLPDS